jgi:Aminoglycoside N3''-acetyltransferase
MATVVHKRSDAMLTPADLTRDLRALGLASGDIVLVRVGLRALGQVEGRAADSLIEALLAVVGEDGTIVGLSHTAAMQRSDREGVFRRDTPVVTGGFAAAMVDRADAYRSRHPTDSMVAIGRDAERLLEDHDEGSTCFSPVRRLIEVGAKTVLIGCVESGPGFTVHFVYEELGLAHKSLLSGAYGAYYEKDGKRCWFSKRDVPGCSMGFGNFYPLYRERGVMASGKVGDAESMLIACRDAFETEYEAITRDPRVSLCDRPDCLSCRGSKLFNLRDMPRFYARRPWMLAFILRAQLRRVSVSHR